MPIDLRDMVLSSRPSVRSRLCRTAQFSLLLLASCSASSQGDRDGSVVFINAERDDAGLFATSVVHVAGLQGTGLSLLLNGSQELPVPSDGVWRVPLTPHQADIALTVATQPTTPAQYCKVEKLDPAVFTVLCKDEAWTVSGTIDGLTGQGLQLALYDNTPDDDAYAGAAHSVFTATAAGAFQFERALEDGVEYHVEVLQNPTSPRQDCVVTTGEGVAVTNISDVQIECTTRKYKFVVNTVGLKGSGLVMHTEAGDFDTPAGVVETPIDYPDGYVYYTSIAKQPVNPNQVCYVQNGDGVIDGGPVNITIICDAQGQLRISEVGACPFSNSACWFELANLGAMPENLAFYKIRTPALSSSAFQPSRQFVLPNVTVPPYGRVVIQSNTPGSMPDGNGVYHVSDGVNLPWWGADGFVELLNPSGATESFLRWGSNTIEPTTGGVYGGGSAPALPKGAAAFGWSIQHPQVADDGLPKGTSFKLYAFATYGGINDVISNDDSDNDGIPDSAEVPGGTFGGLNTYQMGARTGRKDIFIEIDRMAGGDPATTPRKEALSAVVEAFLTQNIFLHFDAGNLFTSNFDPSNFNLGGGNEVPFSKAIGLAPTDKSITNLYDLKAANMDANRRMVFYYQLFAWSQQADGSGGSSGVGELPGNDSIITLGGFGLTTNNAAQRNLVSNYQSASVMHELGHNFSLRHGGSDSLNRKPNYVSIMNYLYSPLGLPTIGSAEGDRYSFYKRCNVTSVTQLTNPPSGDSIKFVLNYSVGGGANLDENSVAEQTGLGRKGSQAVDFNCNSKVDTASYARDLNADNALDVLVDNDDWHALDFVFRRYAQGAESGPSLRPEVQRFDTLTEDTAHNVDEACPAPFVPSMNELE